MSDKQKANNNNSLFRTKIDIPVCVVASEISDDKKRMMDRIGMKIVSVNDMAKRREKNIVAFRKMKKPGYDFSNPAMGRLTQHR